MTLLAKSLLYHANTNNTCRTKCIFDLINYSRFLSTKSAGAEAAVNRLAIGGTKLGKVHPDQYAQVIRTALTNGITTFESGHGGEESLLKAYNIAAKYIGDDKGETEEKKMITLTSRFGYRSYDPSSTERKEYPNDVELTMEQNSTSGDTQNQEKAFHNISKEYIQDCIKHNPLVQLKHDDANNNTIDFVYMVHNPEAQGTLVVKERLVDAFVALERACMDGDISSYGVCSNGLSLPSDHPLYLNWRDVVDASSTAAKLVHGTATAPKLSTLQLPANLLEINGIATAKQIHAFFSNQSTSAKSTTDDVKEEDVITPPTSLDIYISRPLTCYLDGGLGTTHPYKLIDYQIPTTLDSTSTISTHELHQPSPPYYIPTLNLALQHFDATPLLEIQHHRKLTVEERETLEGCKLIRSIIHDLDKNLEDSKMTSFAAYEDELYRNVIPLIYDTFEGLDEQSTAVLQSFFTAHGAAVRKVISKSTRSLLNEGDKSKNIPPYNIPDTISLQQFALQFLFQQECISKIVVGCPLPQHVFEAVQSVTPRCDKE